MQVQRLLQNLFSFLDFPNEVRKNFINPNARRRWLLRACLYRYRHSWQVIWCGQKVCFGWEWENIFLLLIFTKPTQTISYLTFNFLTSPRNWHPYRPGREFLPALSMWHLISNISWQRYSKQSPRHGIRLPTFNFNLIRVWQQSECQIVFLRNDDDESLRYISFFSNGGLNKIWIQDSGKEK